MLSILIPTFNDDCRTLVRGLADQAMAIGLVDWEIVVADDGSTDGSVVACNETLNNIPGCHFIKRGKNVGRAAIRNFLVARSQGDHLLFIDADMTLVDPHYLKKYVQAEPLAPVVCGGYCVGKCEPSNLRYIYERKGEENHSAELRNRHPYQNFHTSNFMIERKQMERTPFDERFRFYGYEDVLFGKQMLAQGIPILHIDNPVCFSRFEANDVFVRKTEEGLRTLRTFRNDLNGYSPLLDLAETLERIRLKRLIANVLRLCRKPLLKRAASKNPSLLAFNLYKIGYYLNLE